LTVYYKSSQEQCSREEPGQSSVKTAPARAPDYLYNPPVSRSHVPKGRWSVF